MATDEINESWKAGVTLFNEGAYWLAHEKFENGWLTLPAVEKLYIQILIQTCAVFYHLEKGRPGPAKRICTSVIAKIATIEKSRAVIDSFKPRPHIDELLKTIEDVYLELGRDRVPAKCKLRARWLT